VNPQKQRGYILVACCFLAQASLGNPTPGSRIVTSKTVIGHQISLRSDLNQYLVHESERISGSDDQDSNILSEIKTPSNNPAAKWLVVDAGNGTIALQAGNGNFLARCRRCFGTTSNDFVTVHLNRTKDNPYAIWSVIPLGERKFAFKADTGLYLAPCPDCSSSFNTSDTVFVHAESDVNNILAQWTVDDLTLQMVATGALIGRNITVQSALDQFLIYTLIYWNKGIVWKKRTFVRKQSEAKWLVVDAGDGMIALQTA
jgi:hypothetical protein